MAQKGFDVKKTHEKTEKKDNYFSYFIVSDICI